MQREEIKEQMRNRNNNPWNSDIVMYWKVWPFHYTTIIILFNIFV